MNSIRVTPGGESREILLRRADLYVRLASIARSPETAERLSRLAERFAAEAEALRTAPRPVPTVNLR